MRKYLPRIAAFLAGLLIMLKIMDVFFDGGYWFRQNYIFDRNARIAEITVEPPDEIDVLNIGDSLSTSALAPLELFRDYGITSFNCGQDGQTPTEGYVALKTALKDQPVKVLLIETEFFFKIEDGYNYPQSMFAEQLRYTFPSLRYHYVWQRWLKKRGFRKYYKGFLVNDGHDPYTDGEYYDWDSEERAEIPKMHRSEFYRMLALCKKNNIKLVLYSAPSPVCYDIAMHNAAADLAKEAGVDYIDANYDRDKIKMNWKKDTHDKGDHLNLSGSRRMTKYLGDYLVSRCDLTDHRGDPDYQSWVDIWPDYEATIEEMKGTFYSIMEDHLGGYH